MCTCTISNVQGLLRLRGVWAGLLGRSRVSDYMGTQGGHHLVLTQRNITCILKKNPTCTCMIANVKLTHIHENTFRYWSCHIKHKQCNHTGHAHKVFKNECHSLVTRSSFQTTEAHPAYLQIWKSCHFLQFWHFQKLKRGKKEKNRHK